MEKYVKFENLKLENMTTRIRLKMRLNLQLHAAWAFSTDFSDH